jgi:lysosomal acid lipase/cholesteryl ester hydrolase
VKLKYKGEGEGFFANYTSCEVVTVEVANYIDQNAGTIAVVRTGGFGLYDYGYLGNLLNYHSVSPPQYDLSAIPASLPILLAHGGNDTLSDPDDVANLISLLQGVPEVLYLPEYAHGDFIIGFTAGTQVYSHILAFFEG